MDKIKRIISNMSINEKARQLTQLIASYVLPETVASVTGENSPMGITEKDAFGLGSVLNFTDAQSVIDAQDRFLKKSESKIPLSFMMDVIHGYRTIFPIPLALACSFDDDLIEKCAKSSATEAKISGISVTFSPMVDLVRDARWGRVMESGGEDPYLNGRVGRAFIRGYHKGGIACCVKHFAGYGAPEAGREYNTTDISERNLKEYYLPAYKECLKESPEMVMSSFNLLNGVPVNARKDIMVDTLRKQWGYDGVVISDYYAVKEMIAHGYVETLKDCAKICVENEIDIEMMSPAYIKHIPELVADGTIKEEQVDKLVYRVLKLKEDLGLLENPNFYANPEKEKSLILDRELARVAAEKSVVLLKNEGVLPLKENDNFSLIGPFAKEKDLRGAWSCAGKAEDCVDIYSAIRELLKKDIPVAQGVSADILSEDYAGISQAVKVCDKTDIAVVCIGEQGKYSGEAAARAKIELPNVQIELLKAIKESGKKVVAVIFGGRPQALTQSEKYCDAILYVWQPGTEGGNAIANILFGKANPSAKLTMSFPRTTGQCPIYYNCFLTGKPKAVDTLEGSGYNSSYRDELNAPLYPFGYGLSYTEFTIENLMLSSNQMEENSSVNLSVMVKNTGKMDGEEVIQLYVRDLFASVVRPIKELKNYKKIFLKVGEECVVNFSICAETLKFFNAKGDYVLEKGDFDIMVGNSSDNLLKARLKVI